MYGATTFEAGPTGTLGDILSKPVPKSKELMLDEISKILELCGLPREDATHALGFWSVVLGGAGIGRGALGLYVGASTAAVQILAGSASIGVFIACILFDYLYGNPRSLKKQLDGRSRESFERMLERIRGHVSQDTIRKLEDYYDTLN